ncbi:hypothetical protein AVEN_202539-1 [Araneus ventricosus]|uniref:Reverse transcriptase domain-containing protein n=1 Tax=Araneus ventricosus TaxID=182803 RepID=A0A4Y2IQA7_ARAVE|nr:hypothetical protein AVEN_202539-1 [Araneus ventricosus]
MDEKVNFPIAACIVLQDVYLDDILTGCSSLKELEMLKNELIQLLKSVGMSLHKWCFSHPTSDFPDLHFDPLSEEVTVKTLGVLWNSSSDTFCFKASLPTNLIFMKKNVLSQIARLFDPLDRLEPVINKAIFFIQRLLLLNVEWHEKLPINVSKDWTEFLQFLPTIEKLKIPRFVLVENPLIITLQEFGDASEKGFGAIIYISVHTDNGDEHSQLLCSKSRVAPL